MKAFQRQYVASLALLLLTSCGSLSTSATNSISPSNDLPEEIIEEPARAQVIGFGRPDDQEVIKNPAVIDSTGGTVAEFRPQSLRVQPRTDPAVIHVEAPAGKPLFIDLVSNVVIQEPKVDYLGYFHGGLAPARPKTNGGEESKLCGYADRAGNMKIAPKWQICNAFRGEVAVVAQEAVANNIFGAFGATNKYFGLIDRTGKELMPTASPVISPLAGNRYALAGADFEGVYDVASRKSTPLPGLRRILSVSQEAAVLVIEVNKEAKVHYWKTGDAQPFAIADGFQNA
jgi:hypothetical protein